MPIKQSRNKEGVTVDRYDPMVGFASISQQEQDRLEDYKKQTAKFIDELNQYKKQCESGKDFETAKFFRQEIASQTKLLRAVRLVLGRYGIKELKDCPDVPLDQWPVNLAGEIDYCIGMVD